MVKQKATADALLATLKRHNPAKVRAYTSDDDHRDIAVPTRRRRWSQVIEAIEALAWSRVEMLDRSGAVLGYVENIEPAAELAELSGGRTTSAVTEAQRIVELVLKAQRETMTFRDSEMTQLLQAQGQVVREMTAGMQALTAMYREQVDAASELSALRATVAAGDGQGGNIKELLEAAPQLLQMLPMLKGLLGTGAAQPAPNGARKA